MFHLTARDDFTAPQTAKVHAVEASRDRPARVVVAIMAFLAFAAIAAACVVLGPSLAAVGALAAFAMMSFIGMPMMLAAAGDAASSEHE
jgi:hypothetical protein